MNDIRSMRSIKISLSIMTFIAIVAAMRVSGPILIPFLLSVLIAVISAPVLFWLTSKKVPMVIAFLLVISGIVVAGFGVGALVGASLDSFARDLPLYEEKFQAKTQTIRTMLENRGITVSDEDMKKMFDPAAAMKLVVTTLDGLGGALTNVFMIILTVTFILLEAANFPNKLRLIFGSNKSAIAPFERFTENMKRYMAIKTVISLGTGLIVAIMLLFMGVSYPFLWGLLAFLLNYIPNIGSIIAAVPPVLLALIQLGPGHAAAVALGFFAINFTIGNIIEPRFMGKELGLSTLIVFLSLLFWGWVLGPVGMLLSVPLTITVKIAVDSSENLQWISVLLGPEVKKKPEVTVT